MRSPGRAHPRTIPMVPAGPHRSGPAINEGDPDRGPSPVQHHGGGSPQRLLPMDSEPMQRHDHVSRVPLKSLGGGARQGVWLHFWSSCHPPQGLGTQSHGHGGDVSSLLYETPPPVEVGRRPLGGGGGGGFWGGGG